MQTQFSTAAQAAIRWLDLPGTGHPVVFIHGLGCAASYEYPRIVADAAWSGRRAILIDLPGSGYSDKPQAYDYSTTHQAEAVAEVIDSLGVAACGLYGHSMGGSIAIETAGLLGSRVDALAVSEPNFYAGGGFFSRQIVRWTEADFVATGFAALVEQEQTAWKGCLQATAPAALWRAARSLTDGVAPEWMTRFLALTCRKALIVGERSLPDADAAFVAGKGIAVHTVASAGHSMSWENPAALAAALSAIMD
ncbi:alpha/beta fold hydrolase [Pluralibacter gergoviae]|uniref:alpha/beta fold hydrolase n=1 Tax=Pluralibacter gergoviae TaxID=61647 RepID=UPI00190C8045|nr:alpha/beta fold hydrolase [Pluralibacter gergoviae]MBK4115833.1 alpha/beta fold hydrolase [Pluralibacter gergoviae]